MNFSQFFLILRARQRIFWGTLVFVVVVVAGVSMALPKTYTGSVSLLMNFKGVDAVTGAAVPGQMMAGFMPTQIDIITSKNLGLRVVDSLKLAQSPAVIAQFNEATGGRGSVRDWLADLLIKKVDVTPSRESSVVQLTFKGADPQFAAVVANAFAEEYQKISVELKVAPLKKASLYFTEQIKQLRDNLEAAQSRLSKYQQDHGLVSVDTRGDVEMGRLNELSGQLVMAQGATMEALSRQRMAQGGNALQAPDVVNNPIVQSLKTQLDAAETRFVDISQRLAPNHPQYIAAKGEIDKLRADLKGQMASTSTVMGNSTQILEQREAALRAAVAAQKTRVLEMNRTRDEMGVLLKDVESAQHAFDASAQRFSQTKIEGQVDQSDISILNPALPPLGPSGPRVFLNVLLAIVFGTVLGLALSVVAELADRRVRSERDLLDTLQVPVLGVIEWNPPRRRRLAKMRALMPARLRLN